MSNQIEIGSKVVCPINDEDGEESHQIGELIKINSRCATVKLSDDRTIKIGKSKIELVEPPKKRNNSIPRQKYNYQPCKAASGRTSCDNGDEIASKLRGKPLEEVYKVASEILETPESELKAKYNHLNPGQQRMCLGNRLRKS